MKTRTGFVSNSSSSSFVVAFDRMPKDAADLKTMLFGDEDIHAAYSQGITTERAAEIVWGDIQGQLGDLPHPRKTLMRYFESLGWYREVYSRPSRVRGYNHRQTPEESKAEYAEEKALVKKYAEEELSKFLSVHKGKTILTFTYGDEDGKEGSVMEHGETFRKLSHKWISQH